MAIVVAEYLGQRTDTGIVIQPHTIRKNQGPASKPKLQCPFKNSHCEKAARGDKPVCTIRDSETQEIWIVCPSRLCATMKGTANNNLPLNEHQKQILHEIAKEVFDSNIERQDVLVDREVPIRITTTSDYSADYVMWRRNPLLSHIGSEDRPMVLEMQGGGETTSTGDLTQHITNWEEGLAELNAPVTKTAPLVTNAWRRQQEQFLVKGNASMLTGGRIAFCIGSMIYNYLMPRLQSTTIFPQLRHSNWSLALLVIVEDKSETPAPRPDCAPHSLPLVIDKSLTLFTSYSFFIQAITNQGSAYPPMFDRNYISLE
jgi:hypothetical protein